MLHTKRDVLHPVYFGRRFNYIGDPSPNSTYYSGGAGVSFRLGDRVGIQLDARAVTLSGYDRRFLNPAEGRVETITPFPEDFPTPPPAKTTAIGTMFTLGFRYVPAAIGGRN